VSAPNGPILAGATDTTRPGSGTGSGRRINTSAMLKLADVAPIPIASDKTATNVNPGFLRNIRRAWRNDRSMGATRQLFHHAKDIENAASPSRTMERIWDEPFDFGHPRPAGRYRLSCFAASTIAFSVGLSFASGAELLKVRI